MQSRQTMSDDCCYVELPGGRRLAYAEWGDPQGAPVFYFHGFPGSRMEARLADVAARRLGIRLIAPDRPGFGLSPLQSGRRLSDWPGDVAAMADVLQLARFHVLGVSGGCPYAIACGQAIAGRIPRLAIVCGLGALAGAEHANGMTASTSAAVRLYMETAVRAHGAYSLMAGPLMGQFPQLVFNLMIGTAGPADQEVLADPAVRQAVSDSFAEAFRGGSEGAAQEVGLFTQPWEIDPTRVNVPVQLWHGDADRTAPIAMGQWLAAVLPDCDARFIAGEEHFSLIVRYMERILGDLVGPRN
jgi:pimeloyl-ACP methyl ester carboxylesterase